FGPTVFERYVYLDTGADKDLALAEYGDTDCYWVEDKPENANVGVLNGLDAILMNHHHNKEEILYEGVTRVNNWKDIYELIVG
ncbi:MAG: hypothetical protein VW270_19295, partial [Candidatus Poseidoniales archaeon]